MRAREVEVFCATKAVTPIQLCFAGASETSPSQIHGLACHYGRQLQGLSSGCPKN